MKRLFWPFRTILTVCFLLASCINSITIAQPIPAEKLLDEPAVSMLKLSPNGDYISMFLNNEEGRFFSVIENETKVMTPVLKFKRKEYLQGYQWLDKNTVLMEINHDGTERRWFIDIKKLNSGLTAQQNLISANGYLLSSLPDDEYNVLYAKQKSTKDLIFEVYRIPTTELKLGNFDDDYLVSGLPKSDVVYVYDDLTDRLFLLKYVEDEDSIKISFMGMQDRIEKPLFSLKDIDYKFEPIGFISDTKLAVITDKLGDKAALHEFDVVSQSFTRLIFEHNNYDLTGATVAADGEIESVTFYDHGRITTEYFTDALKKESQLVQQAFPDSQFSIVSTARNANFKIIRTHASNNPGGYYLFDEDNFIAELLFMARPKLMPYTFAQTETFTFTAIDDKPIEGYLTLPAQSSHHTLLVMPHGGPVGVREYDFFDPTLQFYASRGFAILRVNFRGSSGFGKDFEKGGVGESGRLIESDINLAVDTVLENHAFKKICAMGASYGGYSSFMLAIGDPERYACAAGAFGVYDLPLIFNSSNIAVLEDYRRGWENTFGKLSEAQFDVSPVYLAKDLQVPVLLIGGKEDYQVGFEQTNRMHYVLKKLNKPHEIAFYKNAGHGHNNWWGEWHEHALTYQFLEDSLALPKLDLSSASDEDKKMISSEPLRVAYSYNSDKSIDKDEKRAIKFFSDAAELGNPEALYVLGYYYNQGKLVDKDQQRAFGYLQQASDSGNANASRFLADKYYDGDEVEVDYERAFSFYELAKNQEYHAGINALIARTYCFGQGVEQDVAVCIELLKFKKLADNSDNKNAIKKSSYAMRRNIISEIMNSPLISNASRLTLHAFLNQEMGISGYTANIKPDEYGIVERKKGKFKYSSNALVPAKEGTKIGVSFEVDIDSNKTTGLVVHWVKTLLDGSTEIMYRTFLYGNSRDNWFMHREFSEEDAQAKKWQIRIFDLQNRLAYVKEFTLAE